MYNDVIILISEQETVNEYGDTVTDRAENMVFCDVMSIGYAEFYQASATGFKPEIKFKLPDFLEYKGETKLKYTPYGGKTEEYTVIRTYRNNNELELVCKRGIEQ